jgi:lysophospholipase L1-like esterase
VKKISLSLNIVFILFFFWYFVIHVGIGSYYRKFVSPEEPFLESSRYKEQVKIYEELNKRLKSHVEYDVFVGDSFVEQIPVGEIFAKGNVLNRGIALDSTLGLLKRLEHNVNNISRISRCFLLIGYNDLPYRTADAVGQNVINILSKVRAEKKYFISILPCNDPKSNTRIRLINETVKSESLKGKFEYIDVYHLFETENGRLRKQYFYDGVHLNLSGYLRLQEVLDRYKN